MDSAALASQNARRAAAALNRVRELLQSAHFAARDFEDHMPAGRFVQAELLTDRIHQLRQSAELLALEVESALSSGKG